MKKVILSLTWSILLFCFSDLAVAQNQDKIDSLQIVIATAKKDTTRFYAYADIIQEYAQVKNFEKQ